MARQLASNNQTLRNFLRNCKRVVDDCVRLASTDRLQPDTANFCISRLETLERSIERSSGLFIHGVGDLLTNVKDLLVEFRRVIVNDNEESAHITAYQSHRVQSSVHGAPGFEILKSQIEFFLSCGFSVVQMSRILNVSRKTVQRRLRQFGLSSCYVFSSISDADLDQAVRRHIEHNDHIGPNAVRAILFNEGHRIQRSRVRSSMLRVSCSGVALRTVHRMQRRSYGVAGPNSLWHIDGNHKLIRWRFVIHGGIDGYSRLIVFLQASDNNRQDTVLSHFISASSMFGLPSRIRVDDGGENNSICGIMELLRGVEHHAAIRGASVHNQRIERFWRDMWHGVTVVFYNLFYFLENANVLDCDNERHIWALHYVFLPRINANLKKFQQQWNNHGLRTEHYQTPLQLFVQQALHLCNSSLTSINELFSSIPDHGAALDLNTDMNSSSTASQVENGQPFVAVPAVSCPLSDTHLSELGTLLSSLDNMSDSLGVTQYLTTVAFINEVCPLERV